MPSAIDVGDRLTQVAETVIFGSIGANGAPGQPGTNGAPGHPGANGEPGGAGTAAVVSGPGDDTIQLSGSNINVDAGAGTNHIFILDGENDSFILHANGTDVICGFSLAAKDVLDLRSLLSEANVNLNGDIGLLGAYIHVSQANGAASVLFDPTGTWTTQGSTVAVLQNVGSTVTSLTDLVTGGGVRII
jgi:hypothetical protein